MVTWWCTSGINGANTRSQGKNGIRDSADLFTSDTLKGGAKKPEFAKLLCENSGADVEWFMDKFNLDLSLVARLGGHSASRTHRGKERFPGMTVTCALTTEDLNLCSLHREPCLVRPARESDSKVTECGSHVKRVVTHNSLSSHNRVPMISPVVCTLFYHPDSLHNTIHTANDLTRRQSHSVTTSFVT